MSPSGNSTTDFSAKEPSLGYFYQIKYSLYLMFSNIEEYDLPIVRIESLDDIEIAEIDHLSLFQTKCHIKSKSDLTNSSPDFWKTIRIWCELIISNQIDIDKTVLNLITTSTVADNSFLNFFKSESQNKINLDDLIRELDTIAITSTNQSNLGAYESYQKLDLAKKRSLLSKIRICDASFDFSTIEERLRKHIALQVEPSKINSFLETLEGWWFKKVIANLMGENQGIQLSELQQKIYLIRDSYAFDNLPNNFDAPLEISDEEVQTIKDKVFIKQLNLIALHSNERVLKSAISDFRRAYEQRSKWIRESLLNPEEEEVYDSKLFDHWNNLFQFLKDEAEGQSPDQIVKLGYDFYKKQLVESCPQVKIREKFNEHYLTRGSYHMLSDRKKVGWHPNYEILL